MSPLLPRLAPKSPFDTAVEEEHASHLGMILFLLALAVLFVATIIGFAVIRVQLEQKGIWPKNLPPLPGFLWAGTFILLSSGVTMARATRAARREDHTDLCRNLLFTFLLGIAFLISQAVCWLLWVGALREQWTDSDEFRLALTGFFVLSGLHALHVIGGLTALALAVRAARRAASTSLSHAGLARCALYWHFLDVVWIALFVILLIGS